MVDAFRKAESKELIQQVDNIASIGCDLLVCKEGVDDSGKCLLTKEY